MNGQQQKERQTAVAQLERELKKVEEAALEAFHVEVEARIKAVEECKTLFAKMVDDETTFRRNALRELEVRTLSITNMLGAYLSTFVHLVWWRRWLWVVFGSPSLLWLTEQPRVEPPIETELTADKAVYRGEKP